MDSPVASEAPSFFTSMYRTMAFPMSAASHPTSISSSTRRVTRRSLNTLEDDNDSFTGFQFPDLFAPRARAVAGRTAAVGGRHGSREATASGTAPTVVGIDGPTTRSRKRRHHDIEQEESNTMSNRTKASTKRQRRSKTDRVALKKPPPANLKSPPPSAKASGDDDDPEEDKKPSAVNNICCICMCDVTVADLSLINGCEHRFCFGCIEKWSERENTCPLCKSRFTKIDRVNKKKRKGAKNTKKVKRRNQSSDLIPGAALEGLLANLSATHSGSLARIIFGVASRETTGAFAAASSTTTTRSFSARGFSSHTMMDLADSDDEHGPLGTFWRNMQQRHSNGSGWTLSTPPHSMTVRYSHRTMHTTTTRSYATNMNDATAGNGAENPLEIEDDSDGEVEVIRVSREL